MQTHKAKRVEIIIEAPMEGRLTAALEKAGVTGFTVLPVLGGSGRSGRWTREGQVGRSGIIDAHALTRSLRIDAQRRGAVFAKQGELLAVNHSAAGKRRLLFV